MTEWKHVKHGYRKRGINKDLIRKDLKQRESHVKNFIKQKKGMYYNDYINYYYDKFPDSKNITLSDIDKKFFSTNIFNNTRYINVLPNNTNITCFTAKCNNIIYTHDNNIHTLLLLDKNNNKKRVTIKHLHCNRCNKLYALQHRHTKYILLEDRSFIPKYNNDFKELMMYVYYKSMERMLFFYLSEIENKIYISKDSKYVLNYTDHDYKNYDEVMIITDIKKQSGFSYVNINEHLKSEYTKQKNNDNNRNKRKRKHISVGYFDNKALDDIDKTLMNNIQKCISVYGNEYATAYMLPVPNMKYTMIENKKILEEQANKIKKYFERYIELEKKISHEDAEQKLLNDATSLLTKKQLSDISASRLDTIKLLAEKQEKKEADDDDETIIKMENQKKTMETIYGLNKKDFEYILTNYNFDRDGDTDKPYFFSHSDYSINSDLKFYPAKYYPIYYNPLSWFPELAHLINNKKHFNEKKIDIIRNRPMALSTGDVLKNVGIINYKENIHYRNDCYFYVIPAYYPSEHIPPALQWSHKLNTYFIQKLFDRNITFSMIYYEPGENEMNKYIFIDTSDKQFIGCILIRIKYNKDMIIFVYGTYKKAGWIQKHTCCNTEKIIYTVSCNSNKVDLNDHIFDALRVTYKELLVLKKIKEEQKMGMSIYRIRNRSVYLFSKFNKPEIKRKFKENNQVFNEDELVSVDFNSDTSVFVTFNDSDYKKSNPIVDVTLEQIKIIKRIINDSVLEYITTHMRHELKSLYEFAKLYNRHNKIQDYYAFFSQDVDDIDTGSIGWPLEKNIDKEMEYLYSNGNIREIMTAIANFLKNSKNVKHRGCKMIWDLYLDTNKYIKNNQKIFNINSINARKEELKVLIGYNDLNIIKSRINEIGNETDWCQLAIPFKLTTRYSLTSRQSHHIGTFPSDMRPVREVSQTEFNHCYNTHNTVHYPVLSAKEAKYIKKQKKNKQAPYIPGKCYYKPNTTLTDYKDINEKYKKSNITNDILPKTIPFETQMRQKYNHPNIANVSGHALLIFDILALFRPYTYIEPKMNIFDTIKRLAIISLANIIWLVPPQHHSIHEVLQASILTKFYYDKTDIQGDIDGYIRGEYDATLPIETSIQNLVNILELN